MIITREGYPVKKDQRPVFSLFLRNTLSPALFAPIPWLGPIPLIQHQCHSFVPFLGKQIITQFFGFLAPMLDIDLISSNIVRVFAPDYFSVFIKLPVA